MTGYYRLGTLWLSLLRRPVLLWLALLWKLRLWLGYLWLWLKMTWGGCRRGQVTSCCAYAHLSRFKLFLMELLAFGKKLLSLVFQLRKTKVKKENWFIMKVPNRLFGIPDFFYLRLGIQEFPHLRLRIDFPSLRLGIRDLSYLRIGIRDFPSLRLGIRDFPYLRLEIQAFSYLRIGIGYFPYLRLGI